MYNFFKIDYQHNRRLVQACGLVSIPDRRTFDRRLKTISIDIKERIATMGRLFVAQGLVDPYITAIDSTLLKAKGHVWHKSSMTKGIVPRPGIDRDARWGFSHTRGWIFGYKLHITSTTGSLIVPLTADGTTANVADNQMYVSLRSTSIFHLQSCSYMAADSGYDDHKLYNYSKQVLGIDLVCPIERYENTVSDRLELMHFYESILGQAIYNCRAISVEPLIEHIKSVFRLGPLPVYGFSSVSAIVLVCVFVSDNDIQ